MIYLYIELNVAQSYQIKRHSKRDKKKPFEHKNTNKKQLLLTNPNHNSILYFLVNPINCFLTFKCNYAQAKCYIIHKSNKKR